MNAIAKVKNLHELNKEIMNFASKLDLDLIEIASIKNDLFLKVLPGTK